MKYLYNERTVRELESAFRNPANLVLSGKRGAGMHEAALRLSKTWLKTKGLEENPDYLELTDDTATITKDMAAEAVAFAQVCPIQSPFRVILIDDAERMNQTAQNELLKALEDHAENTRFILVYHEEGGILLPTIRSRCRTIRFRSLPTAMLPDDVARIASASNPGLYKELVENDAFHSFLERIPDAIGSRAETLRLFHAVKEKDKDNFYENASVRELTAVLTLIGSSATNALCCLKGGMAPEDCCTEKMMLLGEEKLRSIRDLTASEMLSIRKPGYSKKNNFLVYLLKISA